MKSGNARQWGAAVMTEEQEGMVAVSHSQEAMQSTTRASSQPALSDDRNPEPAEAAPSASKKNEWVIDGSTRNLYLSLFANKEISGRPAKIKNQAAPAKAAINAGLNASRVQTAPRQTETVFIEMGKESTGRFLLFAASIFLVAFVLYKVISAPGNALSPRTPSVRPASAAMDRTDSTGKLTAGGAAATDPAGTFLTMMPAILLDGAAPGQSMTHTLTVDNHTSQELVFDIDASDVTSQGGKPFYSPAGQLRDSVAATLLYSTRTIDVRPMQSTSFDVTLTLPDQTSVRGVVIRLTPRSGSGDGSITTSLGSFITWQSAPNSAGVAGADLAISQWTNAGLAGSTASAPPGTELGKATAGNSNGGPSSCSGQ